MPKSCNECGMYRMKSNSDWVVNKVCIHNEKLNIPFFDKSRHPKCPLISIDLDELEEALNYFKNGMALANKSLLKKDERFTEVMINTSGLTNLQNKKYNTIKSTIDKLGGKQ